MKYTKSNPLRVVTLCSGYDSQCLALNRLKEVYPEFDYELVAWSEFDPESKTPTPYQAAQKAHNALFPQWADVSIMVEQMAQHFGWYDFHRERARKLNRLEERINKELAKREAPQDEPQPKRKLVIGLDFNGTCLTYNFPDGIGHDIGAVPVLRRIIDAGHQIVLMTGADHEPMEAQQMECYQKSIEWFEKNGIPLVGINNNPTLTYQPKKLCCDLYIDDHCLGIPMTTNYALSDRPFVDWQRVEILLEELGII